MWAAIKKKLSHSRYENEITENIEENHGRTKQKMGP
jgi:hypothetical protein